METGYASRAPALRVSHCADRCRRYPGETVTFCTRVEVTDPLPEGLTLRVTVPAGLALSDYRALPPQERRVPRITWDDGANHLTWRVRGQIMPPACYEYQVVAQVAPTPSGQDGTLESRAVAWAEASGQEMSRAEEWAEVVVSVRARSLKYLPAIYREDDLMGRFLMLFESFWAPIEGQIQTLPAYFDPLLTPPELLPWLASWIDLALDEGWPEEKRRRLLRSAVPLFRKRGTRQGLEEFVEIYTGHKPEITEHRAQNFRLGPEAQLGHGIALGRFNVPHTFTIRVRLPEALPADTRKVQTIIESQKPAHTSYDLHIETEDGIERQHAR